MRASGILMHISSLPSPYGIGTFGKAAFDWIDFLNQAGQKYWQILPLGPTSYGDSPYQSFSTFAGNPYFIDLDLLQRQGLLLEDEYRWIDWGSNETQVEYEKIYYNRFSLLRLAFERADSKTRDALDVFREKHAVWLEDYALFMALKEQYGGKAWDCWPEDIRARDPQALRHHRMLLEQEVQFWSYLQYLFFQQWDEVRQYAAKRKIQIIGDLPIYVAMDSADVWAHPELFCLDEQLRPLLVAGVPPDYFSPDGQKWGNPLYRWEAHKAEGYRWWVERVRATAEMIDLLRIDHFRGFASYYVVPAVDAHARRGHWQTGPGMELFHALREQLGELPIIAEDLGVLTEDVCVLLKESGFPGMKVLQFAFNGNWNDPYLPHNHIQNCVVYTGTHDNDTLVSWWETAMEEKEKEHAMHYLGLVKQEEICTGMLRAAWASVANLVVAPIQDFLELGKEGRMNEPSTLGGNWRFRIKSDALSLALAERMESLSGLYQRSTH